MRIINSILKSALFAIFMCISTHAFCNESKLDFAVIGLDHGHIYSMTNGLIKEGGICRYVFDNDPKKATDFAKKYPTAKVVNSMEDILKDKSIKVVACASIPANRFSVGEKVMMSGKDFFVDKPPMTSLEQLERARTLVKETGKKYIPFFGERMGSPACFKALELIKAGEIGKVVQVIVLAPHREGAKSRPKWFFEKSLYGGVICDIGSHQLDIFLTFSGAKDGVVNYARVDNFGNKEYPELEDFGEASFTMDNGVSCYLRVDWFTPNGLPSWGDGRVFILGTKGYIELRNNIDISQDGVKGQNLYICTNSKKPTYISCGKGTTPFFKQIMSDFNNGTETAITQEAAFKATELALKAQKKADESRIK